MSVNYQLIPFPVPDYLATYFATKLNSQISCFRDGLRHIDISKHTNYGKELHRLLISRKHKTTIKKPNQLYLSFSDWSGNDNSKPRGDRYFYDIPKEFKTKFIDLIKDDFNEALIAFVKGAEFAHAHNGWDPLQKRKGIRKKAITEFCLNHNSNFTKKDISKFTKMIQRYKISHDTHTNKLTKKVYQHLSF